MKRLFSRAAAALLLLSAVAACGRRTGATAPAPAAGGDVEALLRTSAGDIRILLDGRTPRHRDNFVKLAREGFFDSLLFHRVIEGFMIQGGDPDSRRAPAGRPLGEGDAGYTLPAEIVYPALAHTRGALAAAREGDATNPRRASSSSQFYIVWGGTMDDAQLDRVQERIAAATAGRTVIPDSLRALYRTVGGTPHLDGQYTVFGRVTAGLDVVDAIQRVATDALDRPLDDVRILGVEILEN
ncbi:MAG: peptidylprolyl isomerase [Alistipes sp.]|nr:peptidylprolyl isomerase [Alistipes sp.]